MPRHPRTCDREEPALSETRDGVTRWWRGISLRAKVTGVTVALLAIGLVVAGAGTMVFLRNILSASIDGQVQALVVSDAISEVFAPTVIDGRVTFPVQSNSTDYFVAVYGPDGMLRAEAGGAGAAPPLFPDDYKLDAALAAGSDVVFTLASDNGRTYRAAVAVQPVAGTSELFTQLVALPLAPAERVVSTFLAIYGILAVAIVVGGALLTRYLVTLTFRSLSQVETVAMSIAGGDFGQRMDDPDPRTEVGRLKTAINAMLGRVDSAIGQRDATVSQMRRFIGDASHELRTPLVTVRGYAELYRMGAITSPEQVAQSMERIEKEAIRMGVLVEDLLALARLDERRDVVITDVDLRPIARDAASDTRAAAPQREITVIDSTLLDLPVGIVGEESPADARARRRSGPHPTAALGATIALLRRRARPHADSPAPAIVNPPADVSVEGGRVALVPIVRGDENRIRQVVTNLLGNARRFTTDDAPIGLAVGVDAASQVGWIAVIDHGEGIPEVQRDKIFQRFWRADTSRTRETGGSGLGLSIVASIVDTLRGSIDVTETPGGGATFRVSFPLSERAAAEAQVSIETQPLPKLRQL